jgi:hypothetical protein
MEPSREDCGMKNALTAKRKSLSDLLTDSPLDLKAEASLLLIIASQGWASFFYATTNFAPS